MATVRGSFRFSCVVLLIFFLFRDVGMVWSHDVDVCRVTSYDRFNHNPANPFFDILFDSINRLRTRTNFDT